MCTVRTAPRPERARALLARCALLLVVAQLVAGDSPLGRAAAQEGRSTTRPVASAPAPPPVESLLIAGELAKGEAAMQEALRADPRDDVARFSLGVVQALRAVERLSGSLYQHGLRHPGFLGMFWAWRLPLPENPDPKPIDYATFREIFKTWVSDLAKAEATLAELKSEDLKLPLRFGLIRLDLDGDGRAGEYEFLWRIFAQVNGPGGVIAGPPEDFLIAFDRADAEWLRGYCHLLMALAEFGLAYDGKEMFDRTAHLAFARVESPYAFLQEARSETPYDFAEIVDAIAAIHLVNFPLIEPHRTRAALTHLEAMIEQSRRMWKLVETETDDDHEWIPGPRQTGVIPDVRFTPEMVAGWHDFLDEAQALLAGRKLIPFWRGREPRGMNLRRVFTEPRPFDLVLWVQGTAAAPYLEQGELTTPQTWQRLERIFQGEFIGFAIWLN